MKAMKALIVSLFVASTVSAQVISPNRSIDWSTAGVVGGIPSRTTICATFNPGATSTEINSAIASCAAGGVVKLNAGTYTIGYLEIRRSDVTLRGAGPDQTFINFTGGSACIGLWANLCIANGGSPMANDPGTVANWTAGFAKGTTTVTLSTTSGLSTGMLLVLDQLNEARDTGNIWVCQSLACSDEAGIFGRENGARAQMQFVTVTGISGNNVTFTPGLTMPNWRASQTPQAWWINPRRNIGVEDLSMKHDGSGFFQAGTFIGNVTNVWMKNVRSLNTNEMHVWLYQSTHVTIRDSYFYGTLHAASQSYGVAETMDSDNLIENNIFQHIAAPMLTGNSTGTVYAYNYALDDYYASSPVWQQASSYFHHGGVSHILWEGNDGIGFTGDNVHGTQNFGTAFRNYWNGRDPEGGSTGGKTRQTSSVIMMAANRYMNIIGNVLGTLGYHTQYECAPDGCGNANLSIFSIGWSGNEGGTHARLPNDPLVKSTMYRWGNYDTVGGVARFNPLEVPSGLSLYAQPVPGTQTLPISLYLSARPLWFGTSPWPAIGPDVTGQVGPGGHVGKIPARLCFEQTPSTNGILNFNGATCYEAAAFGTLQGTATDSATHAPIAGASVQISGGPSTSTNASGAYTIDLLHGTHSVIFSKAGYVTQTVTNVAVNVGATTALNAAFVNFAVPRVLVTANGNHGALTLSAGQGLQETIAFSSGSSFFPQAEVYVGVARQDGTTLWLDPNKRTFGPTIVPVYQGILGTFGPEIAVDLPDVSALAPGNYWWFVIVDNDSNGVPNGTLLDYTLTTIQ